MTAAQRELVCVVRRTEWRRTFLSFSLAAVARACLARSFVCAGACVCPVLLSCGLHVWRIALWPCAGVLPVWRGPRSRRDAIYKNERAWGGLETRLEAEGGARGDLLPLLPRKAVALSRHHRALWHSSPLPSVAPRSCVYRWRGRRRSPLRWTSLHPRCASRARRTSTVRAPAQTPSHTGTQPSLRSEPR